MRLHRQRATPRPPTSPHHRWPLRAVRRALAVAGMTAVLLAGVAPEPAQAHVPIVLLVLAPKDGQTVTAGPEVVIYAQRMLLGAEQTTYTLQLDQRPIEAANGPAQPSKIRAGQQVHVPLHDLRPGTHQLTITYRPDTDEPKMTTTAAFTVRPAPAGVPVAPVATGAGVALVAMVAAAAWWARRRRRRRLPVGAAR